MPSDPRPTDAEIRLQANAWDYTLPPFSANNLQTLAHTIKELQTLYESIKFRMDTPGQEATGDRLIEHNRRVVACYLDDAAKWLRSF